MPSVIFPGPEGRLVKRLYVEPAKGNRPPRRTLPCFDQRQQFVLLGIGQGFSQR